MLEASSDPPRKKTAVFLAQLENLGAAREFAAQAARACGLGASSVYAVELAVDEAFTNIIQHAYGGESQEEIHLTYQIGRRGLTLTLRDFGHPFNPLEVPIPNFSADLEERIEGGLGLYFMRQLMDEVSFATCSPSHGHKTCNVLTMFKSKESPA